MEKLCESFELCPKYCHLQSNVTTCFHYQIKQCKGICKNEEPVELYNERVKKAIESIKFESENFIIKETGRAKDENAYVLILNGIYKGFGYANKKQQLKSIDDYYEIITSQKDNNDVKRILKSYVEKNVEQIFQLN